MEEVTVWSGILNSEDGGVFLRWYLTEESANSDQEQDEGWCGTYNVEYVETFLGSNIHKEATRNSKII